MVARNLLPTASVNSMYRPAHETKVCAAMEPENLNQKSYFLVKYMCTYM